MGEAEKDKMIILCLHLRKDRQTTHHRQLHQGTARAEVMQENPAESVIVTYSLYIKPTNKTVFPCVKVAAYILPLIRSHLL